MTKVYLAGPDVFLPDAMEVGRQKVNICRHHGLTGLYPLDNTVDLAAIDASLAIFRGNEAMMEAADAIIANLSPFRGAGADTGTVYELGYMAGRAKLCLGYSNDPSTYAGRARLFTQVPTFRSSCSIAAPTFTNFGKSWALANLLILVPLYRSEVPDRIRRLWCRDFRSAVLVTGRDGRLVDADGLTVEDFGLSDNLMMIHALDRYGYALVTPKARPDDVWHDLTAFETCVRFAAERLRAGRA